MPFQASRRHQYWTVDVRYLDMHQLGGGMIYVISILENFSRAILASAVSRTQDLTAYLMVLYAAIRQHGSPEALVSDGGGIFKAKEAMRIYAALGIKKEQIDKKQPWQSYIETHFNVQRRMADWHFAHAETWSELVASHDQFVADYNYQVHWAHRDRQDDRHSPAEVLGWVQGVQRDPAELHRIFYATRFGRTLDKLGYVRFRHWRIYGERGLARRCASDLALWRDAACSSSLTSPWRSTAWRMNLINVIFGTCTATTLRHAVPLAPVAALGAGRRRVAQGRSLSSTPATEEVPLGRPASSPRPMSCLWCG